jgi:tetratricopeptide (TPR) repeat protein
LVRALAIREQQLGAHHPDTATSLNNLAELYRRQGKSSQAEPLYVRALAILENTLGPEHPHTQQVQENYVYLLHLQGVLLLQSMEHDDDDVEQLEEEK